MIIRGLEDLIYKESLETLETNVLGMTRVTAAALGQCGGLDPL